MVIRDQAGKISYSQNRPLQKYDYHTGKETKETGIMVLLMFSGFHKP